VRRLIVTWVVIVAVTGGGAAWASTITGSDRRDVLSGTARADAIFGHGGNDRIAGLAGNDLLDGGLGRDSLTGGAGADRIWAAHDNARDSVVCGGGHDLVDADLSDSVSRDCETVVRQLSRDRFATTDAQHETQVEPASAAFGRTIVATFQSGRYAGGGAAGIGYSTSTDGGTTWRSGFLPGLTIFSVPSGPSILASDPSVAYDAVHRVWLIATLAATPGHWGLYVSRSTDGITWSLPVQAVLAPPDGVDKEWIACDSWAASPLKGRCYISYLDVERRQIATTTSTNGGLSWIPPVVPPGPAPPTSVNGAQPVVRPDGVLVVLYSSLYGPSVVDDGIFAVRSTDGGASFSAPILVARVELEDVYELRSPALPAGSVDAAGRLYAVWQDCRFSEGCDVVDLVLSTSADGITWSTPVRIPTTRLDSRIHSLIPGFAVDPATAGSTARLALVYYTLPHDCVLQPSCPGIDAYAISSRNGGATWVRPERLSAEPMRFTWIADSSLGRMLGDYMGVSFVRGRAVPIFSLASEPAPDGTFRQSIFARVR
jgi:RTX calcium-binding nonapeptide repeat (4 copies)